MPSQQKRILILNRTFPPYFGATGRVACDLVLDLRRKGYDITVLATAPNHKIDRAKRLNVIRIPAPQTPKSAWGYYKILKSMEKVARKLPPHDIVISMTDPPLQATIAQKIANRMKAKHIHWVMDIYPDLFPVLGKDIHPWIYKYCKKSMINALKKADAIVPISKCMARYLSNQSIPKQKMTVIENWPDQHTTESSNNNKDIKPLFDDQKFRILYAGTIGLAHEFSTVLSAAIYFQKTDPDIEFIFTGRGRGLPDLQQMIKKNHLTNIKIIPMQKVQNLPQLMETGDLHLITMKDKALGKLFPSKFYSACATGRPVLFVGPPQCDIAQKIMKHNCGAIIRHGESKLFINAIQNYKNNPDDWFTASNNIKTIISDQNPLSDWANLISKTIKS